MLYITPKEFRLDLHFPRSRFSREFEDRLVLFANKIVELGTTNKNTFATTIDNYFATINSEPLQEKTLANQRTEMIRLFGLAKYVGDYVIPGNRTVLLVKNQDIPRFFKSVCNRFQYPNGINKNHDTLNYLQAGIRFKPAQYVIKLLREGQKLTGKTYAITAKEIAYFVFNDLRVTANNENVFDRIQLIENKRREGTFCASENDVVRYSRDFLNYMVFANLMIKTDKYFFLNENEKESLDFIENDNRFFDNFKNVYSVDGAYDKELYKIVDEQWLDYFSDAEQFNENALNTYIEAFEKSTVQITTENNEIETVTTGFELPTTLKEIVKKGIEERAEKRNLKDIGDEGEMIVYSIEKKEVGKTRPDLLALVRIVSNDTSLGFDIQSIFDDGTKKYIEVKTTKRNYTPTDFNSTAFFSISYNEWQTAKQQKDCYFIFRVIIAKEKLSIYVIQNPYEQCENGKIKLYPIEYRLVYNENSGKFVVKDQNY